MTRTSRPTLALAAAIVALAAWTEGWAAAGNRLPIEPLVQVRPEYERTLSRVYLSVPDHYRAAGAASVDPDRHVQFVRQTYSELIAALPGYTSIDLAVADVHHDALVNQLRTAAGERPFRVHVIDQRHATLDMWAQDLGEPVSLDGETRLLVPMAIAGGAAYNGELAQARRRVADQVFAGRVAEAGFVFEGGNLAFDRAGDRMRVFIGYNDVRLTIENHKRRGRALDVTAVTKLVAADFGGADVEVIGREPQSPFLFHLDQAFILLGDNLAVVNRILGPASREQRQLESTRSRLRSLGYRVVPIDHTQEDVEAFRTSSNAVPFVDAITGDRKIIFPVFPGEVKGTPTGPLALHDLRGKSLAAYRAYEAAGYKPIPVRDFAHIVGGNTHCILNVLD